MKLELLYQHHSASKFKLDLKNLAHIKRGLPIGRPLFFVPMFDLSYIPLIIFKILLICEKYSV